MVDAITGFVVGKMGNYVIEEMSMFMGIKDELEELKTELMCIKGYLKDAEAREREDEASKVWTKLVLDIAYDVEDVLDSYNLKAEERSHRRGMMRLTNKIGEKMDAYNIVDDIRTLKRRILDVTRKRETYGIGIGNFGEPRGGGNNSSVRVRELRRARSVDQEERVVGLEDDAKIILEKLLNDDGDKKRHMISIFGMGGLGKTALARKLYNSEDVETKFQYRAWTYVSQDYSIRDLLMRIIRSLGETSGQELKLMRKFAVEDLEKHLYGLLQSKKYLLVVDDIWERDAWESLKRALPGNHNGSRVIITTRIRAVAEGVDERVYAHKLRFLTFEESWKLFEMKAFKNITPVDKDLQRIGKEMVIKCSGLPIAIVVLGGLMSRKRPNEWNAVYDSLWRRLKDDSIHISTVFDLSFRELRHELKLCFLYLSVFPEDYEIDVEQLIRLLVAEGFIQEDEEMMMEDVARYYIEELIDRSILETVRIERGKAMSCRIHDLLRDVAVKKAKELNFVNVYKEQHSSTTCRREVFHQLKNVQFLCNRRVNNRMRSLLVFGEPKGCMRDRYVETTTLKLKLLRVLSLGGIEFFCKRKFQRRLPDVIGGLIHLRYLRIAHTGIRNIPALISNLQFLQTLDASGNFFQIRTDLRRLTSLRHVTGNFLGELLIGEAVNLQTLRSISSYSWSKLTKHELLINLRDLEIYDYSISSVGTLYLSSFFKLTNLRVLKLEVTNFKLLSESEEAVGFKDVIFPNLESFTLGGSYIEEDLMSVFQKFPKLVDLVLRNCDYPGGKMSISAQGFARLRKLQLYKVGLDELRIEEEAMPNLMELAVQNRDKLTKMMIPDRLRALISN